MYWKGKKINFLGDSITEGVGASAFETNYVNQTGKILNLSCANNYGISGTRIARKKVPSACPEWDNCFIDRADTMDKDADAVVVFGGTNDFGSGDAPLGCIADRTEYTFYGALHVLFEKLATRYVGKPVVVLTPLHRLSEDQLRGEYSDPEKGEYFKVTPDAPLSAYAVAIREVAAYYSFPVLDLWAMSGMQPKVDAVREALMPDGLHPNDSGHLLIAQRLSAFLNNL